MPPQKTTKKVVKKAKRKLVKEEIKEMAPKKITVPKKK